MNPPPTPKPKAPGRRTKDAINTVKPKKETKRVTVGSNYVSAIPPRPKKTASKKASAIPSSIPKKPAHKRKESGAGLKPAHKVVCIQRVKSVLKLNGLGQESGWYFFNEIEFPDDQKRCHESPSCSNAKGGTFKSFPESPSCNDPKGRTIQIVSSRT